MAMLLGLTLLVMAATHAYEVWQSWGTGRLQLGVGVIMAPFFGVPVLFLSALLLRLAWTGGSGDEGWGKWVLILCGVALLSIPVTLVLDPVIGWRLRADVYRRCDHAMVGRYITWNEWIRGSAVCEGRWAPP